MSIQIVEAVDKARSEIIARNIASDVAQVNQCVSGHLAPFADTPHVSEMLKILDGGSLASGNLLELTHSTDPNFILGFFDVPYNLTAFLEAASVSHVKIPRQVLEIAPNSEALPVIINSCTEGFRNPLAVAVFGEHYIESNLQEHHKAYYFIDKFVARHKAYTRLAISQFWDTKMFGQILDANDATLTQVAAIWVWLHEHFHRTGHLPIPRYLDVKSTRNGGGAEELRADLLSILALSEIEYTHPIFGLAIQYIFAERLIRYPLQACPQDNYDARSSVALFTYLSNHGVLEQRDGRMYVNNDKGSLISAIRSLSIKISAIKFSLLQQPDPDKRRRLANLLPELSGNDNKWVAPDLYQQASTVLA